MGSIFWAIQFAIGMGIEDPSSILPDIAYAKTSVGDQATVTAQKTGNLIPAQFLIKGASFCIVFHFSHRIISHPKAYKAP